MGEIRRLHWGCGERIAQGWINSDIKPGPGVNIIGNILDGLPIESESMDYISSQHALQDLKIYEQVKAMSELRRILKPGGVLRLSLPDLDLAIACYLRGDQNHFQHWTWKTLSGNFITYILWHNLTNTPFTYEFAEELLYMASFRAVYRVTYRQTRSDYPAIVELDSRENESFYVEAFK